MNKLKRYIIFLIGLFINSLGVSLITKANLGTSPISSIPYVLSLNFPLTLGNFTIIFSLLLIFLQLLILRKNFKPEYYLQIPVSILFGYFIDFTMILMAFVQPESYPSKIIYLLIGCVILGFGVYIEVLADVVMLPGESFVRAIVQTWNREFGSTKVCFDVSMAVIAAVLSFVLAHRLDGVREGTVIAALLVGFIARQFGKALTFVKPLLFPEDYAKSAEEESSVESAAGYTNVDVPALGEPDGSLKDGGDKLTILCWNDDDLKYMYDIVADATGMDKSMINYKNVGSNGTDANEQYAQVFLSGDDVDLYFCDADWNMAYQNNDEYSAPLSAVGISEDMYANAYDYTVAMGKDKNGVLKGASWQAAAGGYAYRADLAEEYLGVTSPEDMQAQVGSWDDFWKTAATVYEKSGNTTAMADSLGGVWRAYSNGNRTKSWVNDGKLDPSSVGDFISMAKENFDEGYISGATQWSDDWLPQGQSDGAQANKTFGFFFPTWAIAKGGSLEQAEGGEGGSTYGKYALCEGPTSWFWGGTWICVYPKTDNAKEAGQFIYTMTADADAMQKYVDVRGDFVNNKGVMSATTEAGTNSNPLFGGQDQFQILFNSADKIDMSIASEYDAKINTDLQNAVQDYCNGVTASEDDCLNAFLDAIAADVTDITVE